MVQQDLVFPTLVRQVNLNEKPHFQVRPLFVPAPLITHQRYQSALTQLKKEVQNAFKYHQLDRQNAAHLQWFMFRPQITPGELNLQFNLGRHLINGSFSFFRFRVKNWPILFLPTLNNLLLIDDNPGERERRQHLTSIIQTFLKGEKKVYDDQFSPEQYYSNRKDFLTEVQVKINIQQGANKYDQRVQPPLFAQLFGTEQFQGNVEILKVAQDLTEDYPDNLRRAYEREEEVTELSRLFFGPRHTPMVLIGPEGAGRHTLLQEMVYRYMAHSTTGEDPHVSVWMLDPNRVISGMSIVGMWQKRFEAILQYIIEPDEGTGHPDKLVVDNPIALLRIGTSASNRLTLSDVLKPYLEKRRFQLLLIATPEEWAVFQEKDRSLAELFQVHRLPEPDLPKAIDMILEQRKWLEDFHQVQISISAIERLLYIQRNYLSNKALPGAVMRQLEQLAVKHRDGCIDAREVQEDFQAGSGLQSHIFDNAYTFEADEVRKAIRSSLIGQEDAVEALAQVVHLYKAKLNNPERPVSSLLFIGPTGVGKTQAAKVLANYVLGGEKHLLRFDMNEYVDPGAVPRLIGDYYNPEGQLTGKVRYQPFRIILFDEIEKAHSTVRDLLLQVLDDGRLTDSLGRTVDFTNSIIIMTSNLGAEAIDRDLQLVKTDHAEADIYRREMEKVFRPEFINRIDQTIVFRKLSRREIQDIARLQIRELLKRDGFIRRTTILNIQREALQWVADRGYDARMGGRALKRQIERDLTFLSAEQLLRVNPSGPIILDIALNGQHLVPAIHPLTFVSPRETRALADIPEAEAGNRFYQRLGQAIDNLRDEVSRYEANLPDEVEKDWRYFDFKTRLDVLKQDIQTIRIAYSDRYFREALATPLRLKPTRVPSWREDEKSSGDLGTRKAKLFQEAALQELSDAYRFAPIEFDNLRSEFIDKYLNVALLILSGKAFLDNRYEYCTLSTESLVADQGKKEMTYLIDNYAALFEHLELTWQRLDEYRIHCEGYGVAELLESELGIHLFYEAHRNPLPVRVFREEQPVGKSFEVIRIYHAHKTLTDLRSGFTNAVNMTAQEFKLLIYAGLTDQRRAELI